jgi:hypothetical protein
MPFLGKKPTEIASPVDINSGSIDGTTIGGGSASPATVTTFTSTGIDDNATSTAITIDSSENVSLSNDLTVDTNTLVVDSTNNRVGINDSTPSEELDINGDGSDVRIRMYDGAGASVGRIEHSGANFDISNTATTAATMTFTTGSGSGTERMRIASNGSMTTSSHISVGGNLTVGTDGTVTGTEGGEITLRTNDGTADQMYLDVNGSYNRIFTISNNVNFQIGQLAGTGGQLSLHTGGTYRAIIDPSGNFLVGTTANNPGYGNSTIGGAIKSTGHVLGSTASSPSGTFNRNGTGNVVVFYNSGTTAGRVNINSASTVQYITSSDVRLKENIVDAPAGNIDAIRVRSFDWKADGSHQTYGMVAQELVDAAPEAVSQGDTEDDMWGVDYSKLVPMMIKEIQDLKAEVAALKGA